MAAIIRAQRQQPDYVILALVAVLVLWGLGAVYSASFVLALTEYGDVTYFMARQALWAAIGGVLLLVGMRTDYHRWRALSPWLMVTSLGLLALTLAPGLGVERYGASRWLSLGPLPPVEPSEFAKLAIIIYMAAWLSSRREKLRHLSLGFLPFTLTVGLVTGLVLLQPDMGTAVILLLITTTLFFLAGAPLTHLALFLLGGGVASAFLILGSGYRMERWLAFIDPWQDPAGRGFHIIQLLIALGSGGIVGLGPGASRQKFFYIPGSHTDGVFAIIGEELGFVGSMVVLLLLAALVYRGLRIVTHARDQFGSLLAAGIISWFAYQALINIGGITRSIPLTGIPLPFLSYGGSSLAAALAAVGILLNVSKESWRRA